MTNEKEQKDKKTSKRKKNCNFMTISIVSYRNLKKFLNKAVEEVRENLKYEKNPIRRYF